MSSLSSTIYDHVPFFDTLTGNGVICSCGDKFQSDGKARWSAHLADIVYKDFINVTHIPAGPAALPQPTEEAAEVSILINGELHSVIYAKPRRMKA